MRRSDCAAPKFGRNSKHWLTSFLTIVFLTNLVSTHLIELLGNKMGPPMLIRRANTPQILWYQDDVKIVLRIKLIDVKEYFVSVDIDHFRFSTIHNDKVYYVIIYFFGAIIPEKTVNENYQREIKIQFVKAHKFAHWLRLEASKSSTPHIIPDAEKITPDRDELAEEEAEKWRKKNSLNFSRKLWDNCCFEEYRKKRHLNIYPAVSDDDDDSDDERHCLIEDL